MRATVLAVVMLVAAGCGDGGTSGIAKSQLPRLVLQPRDVPGLRRYEAGPPTAFDDPAGRRIDPRRFGRVGGWRVLYKGIGVAGEQTLLLVQSRVDAFRDDDGARNEFRVAEEALTGQALDAKIGDESAATTQLQPGIEPIRYYAFVWRHGNVAASLTVVGARKRLSAARAIALARRQDARIGAAR